MVLTSPFLRTIQTVRHWGDGGGGVLEAATWRGGGGIGGAWWRGRGCLVDDPDPPWYPPHGCRLCRPLGHSWVGVCGRSVSAVSLSVSPSPRPRPPLPCVQTPTPSSFFSPRSHSCGCVFGGEGDGDGVASGASWLYSAFFLFFLAVVPAAAPRARGGPLGSRGATALTLPVRLPAFCLSAAIPLSPPAPTPERATDVCHVGGRRMANAGTLWPRLVGPLAHHLPPSSPPGVGSVPFPPGARGGRCAGPSDGRRAWPRRVAQYRLVWCVRHRGCLAGRGLGVTGGVCEMDRPGRRMQRVGVRGDACSVNVCDPPHLMVLSAASGLLTASRLLLFFFYLLRWFSRGLWCVFACLFSPPSPPSHSLRIRGAPHRRQGPAPAPSSLPPHHVPAARQPPPGTLHTRPHLVFSGNSRCLLPPRWCDGTVHFCLGRRRAGGKRRACRGARY